jgi:hypothetical protein
MIVLMHAWMYMEKQAGVQQALRESSDENKNEKISRTVSRYLPMIGPSAAYVVTGMLRRTVSSQLCLYIFMF